MDATTRTVTAPETIHRSPADPDASGDPYPSRIGRPPELLDRRHPWWSKGATARWTPRRSFSAPDVRPQHIASRHFDPV